MGQEHKYDNVRGKRFFGQTRRERRVYAKWICKERATKSGRSADLYVFSVGPPTWTRSADFSPNAYTQFAFSAPTGLRPKAQGCEERATLGKRIEKLANPEGVAAALPETVNVILAATPLGLNDITLTHPG